MIIRSAAAGGIDGIIWSRRGNAALGPLVIKASAGTLYRAPLIIASELPAALRQCAARGATICILDASAPKSLFEYLPGRHCIYVLGNETGGVSPTPACWGRTGPGRLPAERYLERKDIPSSSPLSVSGYICPCTSLWVMAIDWVYCHSSSGVGFIQISLS
jgi:hypothetical protein